VLDIGTHSFTWQGKTSVNRKVRLAWELPESTYDPGDGSAVPQMVSKEFTLSLSANANLKKFLEGWRAKQFTAEELKQFDLASLLGVACLLTIVHKESRTQQGKVFADIQAASKLPKGMKCPAQITPSIEYSVDDGQDDAFSKLPDWLKKKIGECQEWQNPPEQEPEPSSGNQFDAPTGDNDVPF
jgi:hypothetical protein